ncbi:DUF5659 domain-containing protein [Priestia megaterium]|uniref:DUF5659 domain-containing protein n=2 Tax=Priestia TaxID=2800373 RepID=UPI003CC55DAA
MKRVIQMVINEESEKDYVVFSQRMAGYLMKNGCKLLKVKEHNNSTNRFVYFFPNNTHVLSTVNTYLKMKK